MRARGSSVTSEHAERSGALEASNPEQRALENLASMARRSEWGERLARIQTVRLTQRWDRTDPRRQVF
jgi:hypothetical protein